MYGLGGYYWFLKYWEFIFNFVLIWRVLYVYELYSNGNELGLGMFVWGDVFMNVEWSYKWIILVSYWDKVFYICLDSYL